MAAQSAVVSQPQPVTGSLSHPFPCHAISLSLHQFKTCTLPHVDGLFLPQTPSNLLLYSPLILSTPPCSPASLCFLQGQSVGTPSPT